jgi:hypothetical protein
MYFDGMSVAPVMILDQREPGPREGWIEDLRFGEGRVDVALTLEDGRPAEACLTPDDAQWLELRTGQIVWVDLVPVLRCAEMSPRFAVALSA